MSMYTVRFSYDFLPVHREQVIALIQREVEGARAPGLQARLLVPLTRAPGGPSLHYESELDRLDLKLPTVTGLLPDRMCQPFRSAPPCQIDMPRLRSQLGRTFACQRRGYQRLGAF